ncbi:ATP-dependent DNA helicase RecQ [Anseongella ginsenosidimutans]|uniref:ATP-dependent DNA helicase RecQ n=1 Tax=Anseongella ginsenosidimutans TaxID=496056 RepID=A0A4R3KSS6_9SPHI|nr:ATP-dependent DNA helicase RecQ [Anseongella ginsenosidimutans]QEC53389.1 RecQ family ATP-dependent DNA helicase [Anseongella ginsenosidimutans]TCS88276.1 ATP-dependent DNA helicase RecQ [Anseongella ginsenosidimutans]
MENIADILKTYWGFNAFRPLQEEIIHSVLEGTDTLALMPTGGGKSLCYQVPALAREGICIVVTPLIALMKDQVEQLRRKGIKAAAVFSGMHAREIDAVFDNCIYGPYKFLYLSPERLKTALARERISRMKVNLLAVDEAHCISHWGYDFRPAYLEIAGLRELLREVPVLALTATATGEVEEDIQKQLRFRNGRVLRKSFARENLAYLVLPEEGKQERLLKILRRQEGSGIVYARNRRQTEEIAAFLRKHRVPAAFYHAGMPMRKREAAQDSWIQAKTRVMVATNAFGMGIDKPDVRLVVHMDLPESLEAYYQEAGRAGRDGKKSYAVLLHSPADERKLLENVDISYPALEEIRNIYQALGNYFQLATGAGEGLSFDFDIGEFCRRYDFYAMKVLNAFRFLEKDNYLSFSEGVFLPSRIKLLLDKEALYKFQVAHADYDAVLKAILRSCGGVFDFYVPFDEKLIARRAGMLQEEFQRTLPWLAKRGVVSYIPKTDKPQVTYLSSRADAGNLYLDTVFLRERKNRHLENIHAVLEYAGETGRCRSKMLLSYFKESAAENCGICDYCLKLNRRDVTEAEFVAIKAAIEAVLQKKALSRQELLEQLTEFPEIKLLFVIRTLLDDGQLLKNEDEDRLYLAT